MKMKDFSFPASWGPKTWVRSIRGKKAGVPIFVKCGKHIFGDVSIETFLSWK